MASEKKLTISYSLKVPKDVESPLSQKTGKPIPPNDSVSFTLGNETDHYKNVLAALQEAKEVTGQDILTPWRDAVGDKEKGKDAKKQKAGTATEDGEEEEEEEGEA
ncbi:hypothetical protein FRC18_002643 [Serendipita sp. 400]|nr:hypothetical protein FRC18_002643 [Serendipita sp. 400]